MRRLHQQRFESDSSHAAAVDKLQQELQDSQRRVEGLQREGAATSQMSLAAEALLLAELEQLKQSLTKVQQEQRQSQAVVEQQIQVCARASLNWCSGAGMD